jgi:O-6-methylguanine DNA methyltransferase
MTYYTFFDTPAGTLLLIGDGKVMHGAHWKVFKRAPAVRSDWIESREVFADTITQLNEYFAGTRQEFDFAYEYHGTPFQKKVWDELLKIPFGAKTSYQKIAQTIGNDKAVRAVGTAVGSNPISIVVPCHRVLTSRDTIGGYAGGLPAKQLLLQTEQIAWQ